MSRRLALILLVAVLLAAGVLAIFARAGWTRSDSFLFSDEGHNLHVAAVLLRGGQLYVDAFSQYGPVPAWAHATAARTFGNTPVTYQGFQVVLSGLSIVVVFLALCRLMKPPWAWLVAVTTLAPAMLVPASFLGGLSTAAYISLERLAVAGAVAAWRPAADRSARRSMLLGLLVGSCQWIRFGTAGPILGAMLAIDLSSANSTTRRAIQSMALLLCGAAAAEIALVIWAVSTLPRPVAIDVLWPAYVLQTYTALPPEVRFPAFGSWRLVTGQYAAPLSGALLAVVGLARRPSLVTRTGALALLIYALASLTLFRHAFHFRQFAWLLIVAGAYGASQWPRAIAVLIATALPSVWIMAHSLWLPAPPRIRVTTPAAGEMFLTDEAFQRVRSFEAVAAAAEQHGRRITVSGNASGWFASFNHLPVSRHTWFMRGVVRPWEEIRVAAELNESAAIVVCGDRESLSDLNLPPEMTSSLAARFTRSHHLPPDCTSYEPEAKVAGPVAGKR